MATSLFNSSIRKGLFLALCMMASVVSVWAQTNVAKIGGDEYATLEVAISAATGSTPSESNPVTITIIGNITLSGAVEIPAYVTLMNEVGSSFQIDLNSYIISLNANGTFKNEGTLTITDNSSGTSGSVVAITNRGSLTLSNGFITKLTAEGTESTVNSTDGTISNLYVGDGVSTTISGSGYSSLTGIGSGTVKLDADIASALTIANDNNITIDLCGHNLSGTVTNAGTLTLSNSDSSGTPAGSVASLTNHSGIVTVDCDVTTLTTNNGTVTVNAGKTVNSLTSIGGTVVANGTVTGFANSGTSTISGTGITAISGSGKVTLAATITQELTFTASESNSLTLDLNGNNAGNVINEGKMVVTNSTGAGTITSLTSNENTEVTVNSGTITTLKANNAGTIVTINGGTITTLTTAETTSVKFTNIDSKSAFETALSLTNESTIELSGEISENVSIASGKTITLDLKGNNISGTLSNIGTLVLDDAGKGDPLTRGIITTLGNTGNLTVNQGTITTLTTATGSATINNGTITDVTAYSGTLTIEGGSITGTLTTALDNIVTVDDGTVETFSGAFTIKFPKVNSAVGLKQALKAPKADIVLTAGITDNTTDGFAVGSGNTAIIDVNAQTVDNTGGDTFTVQTGGRLTIKGTGNVNCTTSEKVAVKNDGTFELQGSAVASATLNGTQTMTGGTLTAATLENSKDFTINGGTVETLTAKGDNTVTTTSGVVNTLTANGAVSISGDGFKQFAGPTDGDPATITLTTNLSSNLTVASGKVNIALGDKTISNKESASTLVINSGATLNITGTGSITNNNDSYFAVDNSGTTTISGGNITSVKSSAGELSIAAGSQVTTLTTGTGTATLNGGQVTYLNGNGTIKVGTATECDLTVTGGTVTLDLNGQTLNSSTETQKTVTVNNGATLNVSGTSGSVGKIVNAGTTNVQSGTVTDLSSSAGTVSFSGGAVTTLTATGGNVSITESGVKTLNAKSGSTVTINTEGNKPTNLNVEAGAKVKIGENNTLDFANISTAEQLTSALAIIKGGSLKLTADDIKGNFTVPASSDITIDLNGHSITALTGTALTVTGAATLSGNGTVGSISVAETTGNLTLEGSTITTLDNAGTTTIKSGAVTTVSSSSGTLDIQGGTVGTATATGTTTTTVSAGTVTTLNTSSGTTTISDNASVNNLNATGTSAVTISGGNVTTATAGESMIISGGEVGTLTTTANTDGDAGLSVTAGTITTLNVVASSIAAISGGTISSVVVADATLTVSGTATVTTYSGDGGSNVNLPHYDISDENAGSYPKTFVAETATYTRTTGISTDNVWGTLCLPFSYTSNSGNDIRLYSVSDITTDNQLNLTEITSGTVISAGTPFVFHIQSGIINTFTSSNATVRTDAEDSQSGTGIKLVGVNTEKVFTGETNPKVTDCYFISENTFHQAKAKLTVPKYRAYLVSGGSSSARPSVLSIHAEPGTTALDTLFDEDSEIIGYYDMNGVMHDAPQKGMNIVKMSNGKSMKLMIK